MSGPWTTPFPDLHQRMDELFDELIFRRWSIPGMSGWRPPVDLHETRDAYLVVIDLPDVPPDRVEIRVTDCEVVIAGDRPDSAPADTLQSHRERRCGPFRRGLALAEPIDPEVARAEYQNGTCRLRLPKRRLGERFPVEPARSESTVARTLRILIH
ncbi:Hsp20/alpha crystallin family protein [Tautonia marina]|uniref:Hsp20/alpha crystallin family protein n=1 Tax=Tautonia marina TaxID=2653855 RepID=UPI001260E9E6|nr:Hsp20/alpha crystallin family protein [Tautonia marina]